MGLCVGKDDIDNTPTPAQLDDILRQAFKESQQPDRLPFKLDDFVYMHQFIQVDIIEGKTKTIPAWQRLSNLPVQIDLNAINVYNISQSNEGHSDDSESCQTQNSAFGIEEGTLTIGRSRGVDGKRLSRTPERFTPQTSENYPTTLKRTNNKPKEELKVKKNKKKTVRHKSVKVEPGYLGISISENGTVSKIKRDTQKAIRRAKIMDGWKIKKIGNEPYTKELLRKKVKGRKKYVLKFSIELEPNQLEKKVL